MFDDKILKPLFMQLFNAKSKFQVAYNYFLYVGKI